MKRFEKIVSWFTAFLEKAKRVFSSRRFLIGTGAFTLLFVGVYVNYAVAATIVNSNPAQACGKQFLAYRQTVITQGSPLQPVGIESYTYRFETEIEGENSTMSHLDAIAHFTDCIERSVPTQSDGKRAIEIMRIIDAMFDSAENGGRQVIL